MAVPLKVQRKITWALCGLQAKGSLFGTFESEMECSCRCSRCVLPRQSVKLLLLAMVFLHKRMTVVSITELAQ